MSYMLIHSSTVTSGQPDSVSKYIDDVFDQTFNHTLEQGGLPHVRFGRIDYMDVTAITTKWAVWKYACMPAFSVVF